MAARLKNLRLDEVSLVDRGANQHAHVTLFKRDYSADERKTMADKGEAMAGGRFPIKTPQDVTNAVHDWGRAGSAADVKAHIISRARSLGATDKLPDGWTAKKRLTVRKDGAVTFDEAQESQEAAEFTSELLDEVCEAVCALRESVCSIQDDPDVTDKQSAVAETFTQFKDHVAGLAPADVEKALTAGLAVVKAATGHILKQESAMTDEEKKKAEADKAEAEKTKKGLEDNLAKALGEIAILKMSDKHKEYADKASMTPEQKAAFAAKTPDERDAHMAKNSVEKALPESVQKALADAAADRVKLAKLLEKDEITTFGKRAVSIGLPEEYGDTLRKAYSGDATAISKIEQTIKGLTEQVKTGKIFEEFGTAKGATSTAEDQIMAKAEELRKVNPKLSQQQAYTKVYTDPANRELVSLAKREAVKAA